MVILMGEYSQENGDYNERKRRNPLQLGLNSIVLSGEKEMDSKNERRKRRSGV